MLRREFISSVIALCAAPGFVKASEPQPMPLQTGEGVPFSPEWLLEHAKMLSEGDYVPNPTIPQEWIDLEFDEFRHINFDSRNALWTGQHDVPLRVDVFPTGLYYDRPVNLYVVEDGQAESILFNFDAFRQNDLFPKDLPIDDTLGYSGLRLRGEIEDPGLYTEFAVFHGASYFRAIATGQNYGLSARGLAIDTAEPSGEEFPDFTDMWLEKPKEGETKYVLHALLDSPSVTGVFRFDITPGQPLIMDVSATLFPRVEMKHVGLGALTSMFQFDETNRDRFSDFRGAVHDSDGLLILNGLGETIWRPLANPRELQVSAFQDNGPKGFGLMQRPRDYDDYSDLEAHYHKRPGLWIEPNEDWGAGAVTLVEIPTDREIYDNIVAYWRPKAPLLPGEAHHLSYKMTWGDEPDTGYGSGVRVLNTSFGTRWQGPHEFVIQYEDGENVPADLNDIEAVIRSSAGEVGQGVLQRHPETGGVRLAFTFDPKEAGLAEFRVYLQAGNDPISEVWLYRWTT